jgi:prepilin-type N-terminal cleavage/methylation domain-containing protein
MRYSKQHRGLSLLEVVLALAILAMASAYLAQSMMTATNSAITAEKLNQAELVAENVMNQLVAGVIPAQPVTWTTYVPLNPNLGAPVNTTGGQAQWMYQIQQVQAEVQGMLGLQVSVRRVEPDGSQTEYDLIINRWIIDPALELDQPPAEEDMEGTEAL